MSNLPTNVITIAGLDAGVRVNIKEGLDLIYANIQELAKKNHWASLCVRQVESLTSGQVKKNVFIQNMGRREEFGEYSMILPGCRASFRKTSKGEFYIYALEADDNYSTLQAEQEKPGLYNVKKKDGKWNPEFIPNGEIAERKVNVVAVTDQFERIDSAIILASKAVSNSGRVSDGLLDSNGFDMHFTPGGSKIGGLGNSQQARNADTDPSLHESAILLAETMKAARKVRDVSWVSERGGSGVLTQAMQILKDGGVSFADSGHVAFFSKLTTNLVKADQLARAIGLEFDGGTHSKEITNLNQLFGSGLGGGFRAIWNRDKKEDKFSDLCAEFKAYKGAYGVVAGAPGAVVACYSSTTVAAAALKITTTAAAFSTGGLVFAAAVAALPVLAGGNALVKSYFPLQHHHVQSQLKKLIGKS